MEQRLFQLRSGAARPRPAPHSSGPRAGAPRVTQSHRQDAAGGEGQRPRVEGARPGPGPAPRRGARALGRALSLTWAALVYVARIADALPLRHKLYAAAAALLVVMFYLAVTPTYRRVGGELNKRLEEVRATTSSAPFVLTVGDRRPLAELVAYLQAAGYSEAASAQDRRRGLYRVVSGQRVVEIYPGGDETVRRDSVKVAYEADGSTIKTITLITTGETVVRWEVKPLELATYEVERLPDGGVALTAYCYASLDDLRASRLAQAVEDVEDRRFRVRWLPVDFRSAARAFVANARAGRIKEGGSTIYQQLAKQLFVDEGERAERSWSRKWKELYYAFLIWPQLSKEQVRELYLNTVPAGASVDGIRLRGLGSAARACYGKHPANLSASEVAALTTLIESAKFSPLLKSEKFAAVRAARTQEVARKLIEDRLFAESELGEVLTREPDVRPLLWPEGTGDFLALVRRELEEISGRVKLPAKPLRVAVSLDPVLQSVVRDSVEMNLPELRRKTGLGDLDAAVVILDVATGSWLAVTGGADGDRASPSRFNLAFQARRQPGSTFKPVVYTAAFETALIPRAGVVFTPANMVMDAPTAFTYGAGGHRYSPGNYGGHYRMRPMSLFDALAASSNVVTVRVTLDVGPRSVADKAEAAGLPRPDDRYPSLALGTTDASLAEMVRAYSIYLRGGRLVTPHAITRVESADDSIVFAHAAEERQVTDPRVAYMVLRGMVGVFERPFGTAHQAKASGGGLRGVMVFGKTGTSRDSWFIGGTSRIICGVFVGRRSFRQSRLTGAAAALKIWTDAMTMARRARPELFEGTIPPPPGVVEAPVDPSTGKLAGAACPDSVVYPFIAGTEPKEYCDLH